MSVRQRTGKQPASETAQPGTHLPVEAAVGIAIGIAVGIFVGSSTNAATGLLAGIGVAGVMHRLLLNK